MYTPTLFREGFELQTHTIVPDTIRHDSHMIQDGDRESGRWNHKGDAMKVRNSLRSAKKRHKDCKVVRRRGRTYVICKSNPRFKTRQGGCKKKPV